MAPSPSLSDRWISLPEHIAHQIITLLPTIDFLNLSFTSKICRKLCLSLPSLTFDPSPRSHDKEYPKHLGRVLDQLNVFMIERRTRKIESFSLCWYPEYKPKALDWVLLTNFLTYAILSEVEDLKIQLTSECYCGTFEFYLPPTIYYLKTLRSLKICVISDTRYDCSCYSHFFLWKFSPSIPFLNLQFLTLNYLKIWDNDEFSKWVSTWPRIKEIKLFQVFVLGALKIESSVLEHLVVSTRFGFKFSVSCEKLERLYFELLDSDWDSVSELGSLEIISTPNLKYFTWVGDLFDDIVLNNLTNLELVKFSNMSPYKYNKLLSGISSTKELHIHGNAILKVDASDWKNLSFLNKLEKVEMEIFNSMGISVARFLFKNAINLKEMVIFRSSSLSFDLKEKIRKLRIKKFNKVVNNGIYVFKRN